MSTHTWRHDLEVLRAALTDAQQHRDERMAFITLPDGTSELGWVLHEREQMLGPSIDSGQLPASPQPRWKMFSLLRPGPAGTSTTPRSSRWGARTSWRRRRRPQLMVPPCSAV